MAKRRNRPSAPSAPERERAADRRARRKAAGDSPAAKQRRGSGSLGRRVAIVAIPIAAIAVVVVLVAWGTGNLFSPPCLQLTQNPSGQPGFPPRNTTDFSRTWCPNAPLVMHVHILLKITIGTTAVSLPGSIGRNTNFTNYECDLPLHTHPDGSGLIHLESPWPYWYTLGDFFGVWKQSYASAYVNQSYSSQPIVYTPNDLLGFTVDPAHTITLFVDNQPSNAGPNLTLDNLDYAANPYPSCLAQEYGTGHVVSLSYTARAAAAGLLPPPPSLQSLSLDASHQAGLYDSPGPASMPLTARAQAAAELCVTGLGWFVLRAG